MTRAEMMKELDRIIDVGIVNAHHDTDVLKEIREQLSNPVYIVTAGCYSDYHIEGVFLSEESARKYASLCDCEDSELETYVPMDRADGHKDEEKLILKYKPDTNKIISICFGDWIKKDRCWSGEFEFSLKVGGRVGQDVILNGPDSELALKVAQDRYAAWKYENELIETGGRLITQKDLDAMAKGGSEDEQI